MKLPITTPCPTRPTLTGTSSTTSACALCKKSVHHLSRMTEAEGRAVLKRTASEDTCVRYVANAHGDVVFAPALRRVAAAGMLVFAPVAFADGGDVVAQAQAEMNRVQNEMHAVGIHPDQVVVDPTATVDSSSQDVSKTAGTKNEPVPEPMIMWDGGI